MYKTQNVLITDYRYKFECYHNLKQCHQYQYLRKEEIKNCSHILQIYICLIFLRKFYERYNF